MSSCHVSFKFIFSHQQTTFHYDDSNTNFLFDFANSVLGVLPHFCWFLQPTLWKYNNNLGGSISIIYVVYHSGFRESKCKCKYYTKHILYKDINLRQRCQPSQEPPPPLGRHRFCNKFNLSSRKLGCFCRHCVHLKTGRPALTLTV